MIDRKLKNAIYIKFKNMMNSIAIQLCLFLILLASLCLSFLPWIQKNFFQADPLSIKITNIDLNEEQFENIKLVDKNADVEIIYQDKAGKYLVTFLTENGKNGTELISRIIMSLNIEYLKKTTALSAEDMLALTNNNIEFEDKTDSNILTEEQNIFIMMIVLMFFLMTTILISRIGAMVSYEKGTMVTEVILTSVTPGQLFIADVVSSAIVIAINVVVVILPMIVANIIGDNAVVSDFSFLKGWSCILIILHLVLCIYSLVLLCIALCSISKRAEDSNAYSTIMLMPVMVSYLYTIFKHNIFQEIWCFLNYIPFFSVFPVLAVIITGNTSIQSVVIYIIADLIFLMGELLCCKKIYTANISKHN